MRRPGEGKSRSVKSKLLYGAVVLATLAVSLSHDAEFPRFLLGFEFLLAGALYLCVRVMAAGLEAQFFLPSPAKRRGEAFELRVRLRNSGYLPAAEVMVEAFCRDVYSGKVKRLKAPAMVDAGGTAELIFRLKAEHCGVVRSFAGDVWVRDYLGLFRRRCTVCPFEAEYCALPDWGPDAGSGGVLGRRSGAGTKARGSGDDLSEIADIRGFREGDGLHSIHWKLSARFDEWMIRVPGDTADTEWLLFLDLYPGENGVSRSAMDVFYDRAAALSFRMMCAGVRHEVIWVQEYTPVYCAVRDEASFREMLVTLLHAPLCKTRVDPAMIYKERFWNETYKEAGRLSLAETHNSRREGQETA